MSVKVKAAENPDRITQSRWIKNSCLNYSRLDRTCALRLGAGDSLTEAGFRLLTAGLASDLLVTAGLACGKFLRLLLLSLITIVCDLIGGRRSVALLTIRLLICSSSNSSSSTSSSGSGLEAELEVALDELRLCKIKRI